MIAAAEYEYALEGRGFMARLWSALLVRGRSVILEDSVWAVWALGNDRFATIARPCGSDIERRDAVWLEQSARRTMQYSLAEYSALRHEFIGNSVLREVAARMAAELVRLTYAHVKPEYKDVEYALQQERLPAQKASTVGLMLDVFALQKKGHKGAIQVTKYLKGGVPHYIVGIPGTVASSSRKKHPLDMLSNIDSMYRDDSSGTKYVLAAMKQAGVEPGANVIFAGHSQGGLIASALGSRSDVTDRYKVRGIVTMNAPVAHNRIQSGIPALHIENRNDLVTALDIQAVSTSKDRVQVVGVPVAKTPGAETWSGPHDVEASINILGQVQGDPAVREASERIEEFLPDEDAKVVTTVFDVVAQERAD